MRTLFGSRAPPADSARLDDRRASLTILLCKLWVVVQARANALVTEYAGCGGNTYIHHISGTCRLS
jgi:hypothetical protein